MLKLSGVSNVVQMDTKWSYRAEGNGNVVLGYYGSQECHKGKIIRISKQTFDNPVLFIQRAIQPLFPSEFILHSEAIQVESHWLKTVLQQVEKDRPIHRKVNALDTSHLESPIAFLQPDATLVPGTTMRDSLAIEIKPKWGFLPKDHESFHMCRYCLHQRYKFSKGTIQSISSYCPLDLYSGDALRMKRALRYLSECNQNNFRCFINGKMVDFYSVSDGRGFIGIASNGSIFGSHVWAAMADKVLDIVLHVLLKESLLTKLLLYQKTLDGHGIEKIYRLYQEYGHWNDHELDWSQYTPILETSDPISVTLKDCSILIALHPGSDTLKLPHVLIQETPVYYRITLVDLDAKKGSKIPHYFNLQKELMEFSKTMDSSLLRCCKE